MNLVTATQPKWRSSPPTGTVALTIFAGAAQVNLALGGVLAAGNSTGALISSQLALKKGAEWIRWFLIVAAVAAAIRMFIS